MRSYEHFEIEQLGRGWMQKVNKNCYHNVGAPHGWYDAVVTP